MKIGQFLVFGRIPARNSDGKPERSDFFRGQVVGERPEVRGSTGEHALGAEHLDDLGFGEGVPQPACKRALRRPRLLARGRPARLQHNLSLIRCLHHLEKPP